MIRQLAEARLRLEAAEQALAGTESTLKEAQNQFDRRTMRTRRCYHARFTLGLALDHGDHSRLEVDEERLAGICDSYGIAELKVIGSRARGDAEQDSDIDILYTLRPGRRLGWEVEQLADELSGLFGHCVDLVSLHPLLQPSVLAEAKPVYAA